MINDVSPPEKRLRRKLKRIEPLQKPASKPLHEQAKAIDSSFQTPEETAAAQEAIQAIVGAHDTKTTRGETRFSMAGGNTKPQGKWLHIFPKKPTKKQFIIGGSVLFVLIASGVTWGLTRPHHATVSTNVKRISVRPIVKAPVVIYSTLTGLPVADATINQKPVTGVMIENSFDARPQSGLGQAGVVFEAVAEGGVTRFLALFQDTSPDNVGPIRSARPYYVSWAMGFDAAYAHVGGSDAALADITSWGVHDMNQFYNGGSYHRITTRDAPHNVYTAISTLNQLESTKGYSSTYTGFPRVAPVTTPTKTTTPKTTTKPAATTAAPVPTTTPATSIDFALSGPDYNPHYDYTASTNTYARSEAGTPHIDANTNQQISPKVVIGMVVPLARGALDSSGAYYSDYTTIGSGQAYIFQNGTVVIGQWSKSSNSAQISFTDANGKTIPLEAGQTWITAVSSTGGVSYK